MCLCIQSILCVFLNKLYIFIMLVWRQVRFFYNCKWGFKEYFITIISIQKSNGSLSFGISSLCFFISLVIFRVPVKEFSYRQSCHLEQKEKVEDLVALFLPSLYLHLVSCLFPLIAQLEPVLGCIKHASSAVWNSTETTDLSFLAEPLETCLSLSFNSQVWLLQCLI